MNDAGDGHEPRPDLEWRERIAGRKPGDRIVRISRPHSFRRVAPGVLVARGEAIEPTRGVARVLSQAKHVVIGNPIPTAQEIHERLTKVKALAVFSSDALSSVAYATEAIMRTLILAGVAALSLTLPVTAAVTVLLVMVAASYRQTIRAYPSGGGSYIVAHENLGVLPGLVAAGALLVDYVLTVAVSVAAGVDALKSAFPAIRPFTVEVAVAAILVIAILNLRGVRESGSVFAAPTYVFVVSILGLIAYGLIQMATGGVTYVAEAAGPSGAVSPLTWALVLSAFARGCTAMTGTEAVANGVPAFRPPESANASRTLAWMAFLLGAMFLGVSLLVTQLGIVPDPTEQETVLSQLTRAIAGTGWFYYLVQFATALILFLAGNTSYAGFPRLLSILAKDRYVPRWFAIRGDRLAFSFGIGALTTAACLLIVVFGSNVQSLLPLYAIGVFTSFTLSQSGMVMHWLRERGSNWRRSLAINGLGAFLTAIVTAVIASTKFLEGAWLAIVAAALLVLVFYLVSGHYRTIARQLRSSARVQPRGVPPLVVVPVSSLSVVAREALAFAQDMSTRVLAVHVTDDPTVTARLRHDWDDAVGDVPLVTIETPYRGLYRPLLAYIDSLHEHEPEEQIVVLLPEFVPRHWWEALLHNQTALRLKAALYYHPRVVVADFPYHLT